MELHLEFTTFYHKLNYKDHHDAGGGGAHRPTHTPEPPHTYRGLAVGGDKKGALVDNHAEQKLSSWFSDTRTLTCPKKATLKNVPSSLFPECITSITLV